LATSTTEKDELNSSLTLRSYHHHPQHHAYYQAQPPPPIPVTFSSSTSSNYSKQFQPQMDYNTTTPTDMYEMTASYCMKQSPTSPFNPSNYYTNGVGNNLKTNYIPPTSYERPPPVSFDSYYYNSDTSPVIHHQQSGPAVPPFA